MEKQSQSALSSLKIVFSGKYTTIFEIMGNMSILGQKENTEVRKYEEDYTTTGRRKRKWKYLEHNGPCFPAPYQPLPERIPFLYDNKKIKLSPPAEEIATFYAKITKKDILENGTFKKNFFDDWRQSMTDEERSTISDLTMCNFRHLRNYFQYEKRHETEIQKDKRRKNNELMKEKYGFCKIDGILHEIDNYKIETGLFLGRGDHPKIGRVKRRIFPEDVIINCGEDSQIPKTEDGHNWKQVVHDETVSWLAKWRDNVLNRDKYIKLKTSSKLKSEDDQKKYQKAQELDREIIRIRKEYLQDLSSEDDESREIAIALYLIDQLGFRTGNDKTEDEADTFGCCSLQVKHVQLQEKKNNLAVFDFLGKSSIRHHSEVSINEKAFKNLQNLQFGKTLEDPLFNQLTPNGLNSYLEEQMEGLTAKVFRTYNASCIFEKFLDLFTDPKSMGDEKIRCYKCANLVVAIWLNHRSSVEDQDKKEHIIKIKKSIHEFIDSDLQFNQKHTGNMLHELKRLLFKNKEILTQTSKDNYLDPRISVVWCEKFGVGIERIFTKMERKKFDWAITLKDANFKFSSRKAQ